MISILYFAAGRPRPRKQFCTMRANDAIPLPAPDEEDVEKPVPDAATLIGEGGTRTAVDNFDGDTDQRPINIRFLLIFLVTSVALAVGFWGLHEYQMVRMAHQFQQRADLARKAGDIAASARNLQLYLALVPNDLESRIALALARYEIASTPRQIFECSQLFEQVLREDESRNDIRNKLVDISLVMGRYTDAAIHLDMLLHDNPNNVALLSKLALCHRQRGNLPEAIRTYRTIIEVSPRDFEAYGHLADLLRKESHQDDESIAILDKLVASNLRSHQAYLIRSTFRKNAGMFDGAIVDAKRAFQLAPRDPDVLVLVAELISVEADTVGVRNNFSLPQVREALATFVDAKQHTKKMRPVLARLDVIAGHPDLAEMRLRNGLQEAPEDIELQWLLCEILAMHDRIDEARRELKRLVQLRAAPELVDYIEGRLAMSEGDWLTAARKFEEVQVERLQHPELQAQVNSLLGTCYKELGNTERQLTAFRQALDSNSTSLQGQVEYADALAANGRVDEALQAYRQLIGTPGIALKAARLLIERNLRLPAEDRSWVEIDRLLDRAGAATRDNSAEIIPLRATVLLYQDKFQQARAMLEKALERDPRNQALWITLSECHRLQGDDDKSLAVLRDAQEQLGSDITILLAEVRYWSHLDPQVGSQGLQQIEDRLTELGGGNDVLLLRALAVAHRQLGDLEKSTRLWTQVSERQPHRLDVWRALLELSFAQRDADAAIRNLNEIRRVEGPDGVHWRLGEARRLVMAARAKGAAYSQQKQNAELERARTLLKEVNNTLPGTAEVQVSLGQIDELTHDDDNAIEHYLLAIDMGIEDPELFRQIIRLLYKRHRYFEAEQLVLKFQSGRDTTVTGDFSRLAAEISIQTKDFRRAVQIARDAAQSPESTYRDHVWLGQILSATGNPTEAEEALRTGVRLGSAHPDAWIALIHFLVNNQRIADAQVIITQAASELPPEIKSITLAQCHEILGQYDEAARYFESMLAESSEENGTLLNVADFYMRHGREADALPLLQKILKTPEPQPSPLHAAARRDMALLLTRQGGYPGFRQAMELLDRNFADEQQSIEDRKIKARLLASQPQRQLRLQAISLLNELDDQVGLTTAEQFLVVRLYVQTNNWFHARDAIQALVAANPESPEILAFSIQAMIDHAEHGLGVAQWLADLERVQPGRLRNVELRAQLVAQQESVDAAIAVLRKRLDATKPDDPDASEVGKQITQVLIDLSRRFELSGQTLQADRFALEAENLLQSQAKQDPARMLTLIRLLGQRWRLDEAFQHCREVETLDNPDEIAMTYVELLRTGQAAPEHFEQAINWLKKAAAANPESAQLQFQLANAYHLYGDFDLAEAHYVATLKLAPSAVAACNELSLLRILRGKREKSSLDLVNRALNLVGPLDFLLDTRASIYLALDQPKAALQDLERCIEDAPSPTKYFHLAQAQMALKNRAAAETAFAKAIAAGLHIELLHPLEKPEMEKLATRLKRL